MRKQENKIVKETAVRDAWRNTVSKTALIMHLLALVKKYQHLDVVRRSF
jgi:hypothetical protein